jgi:hypothetical protein
LDAEEAAAWLDEVLSTVGNGNTKKTTRAKAGAAA